MTSCLTTRGILILAGFDVTDPDSPVRLGSGWDRGAAQPALSDLASSILDGAAKVGTASGNRTLTIPLHIHGDTRVDVAMQENIVLQYVNQATWQLSWTPGGGYTVIYECYRATVTTVSTGAGRQEDEAFAKSIVITCEALPFAHSPDPCSIKLSGSNVLLDNLDGNAPSPTTLPSVTVGRGVGGSRSFVTNPAPKQGSRSLSVSITESSYSAGDVQRQGKIVTVSRTGQSISIPDGVAKLSFYGMLDGTYKESWSVDVTVTTSDGTVWTGSTFGQSIGQAWALITVGLDDGGIPALTGLTVTGWSIRISTDHQVYPLPPSGQSHSSHVFLDALIAYPFAAPVVSDGQGSVVRLSIAGTARTPYALQVSKVDSTAFRSWLVHSAPADAGTAQPLIPLGGIGGPTYVTSPDVRYNGTYVLYLIANNVGSPGASRSWTTTFIQSGFSQPMTVVNAGVNAVANRIHYVGQVVLPLASYPPEGLVTLNITVQSSNPSDTFNDLLLLDTRGQTVLVNSGAPSTLYNWIDPPDPTVALGGIYAGNNTDRTDASSVTLWTDSADRLLANPGSSTLLLYSPEGALQGTATYLPRWLQEATQ